MLDHVGLSVSDYKRSKAFYLKALAPLGYGLVKEFPGAATYAGFGTPGKPDFWIDSQGSVSPKIHIAFAAKDRATVDAFHAAALQAGGRDNGPPGLRPDYHPNYYGAFVLDPDDYNIEVVCHTAP